MIQITLIRHAPTTYNLNNIFMGDQDIPISDVGADMAQKLRLAIGEKTYARYYCSPLIRTIDTARLIFPDAEFIIDACLKERGLGQWAGKSKQEIRNIFPKAFLESGPINPYFTPPDGEPLLHFLKRVSSFLSRIIDCKSNQNILIITHHGVIRVIRCLFEKRPLVDIFSELEPALKPRTYKLVDISSQMIQKRAEAIANKALDRTVNL